MKHRNKQILRLTALFSIMSGLLTVASCKRLNNEPVKLHGKAQGTYYNIIYYDNERRNLQKEIDSLLSDFDLTASLWVDSSMLRRVNDNRDSVVNEYFADLIRMSVEMAQYTEGCFDCTIGTLVKAWGFSFAQREELNDKTIDSLLQYTGEQPTIVRSETGQFILRKSHNETALDFNAIAQGYSSDLVGRFLRQKGITNYLVDIGGEVIAQGSKHDGSAWKVGIERPAENKYSDREVETTIELKDQSVVTSGSYRKYYEKDGMRYSHTIDPSTGRPVEHTLLSVSVVDSSAWRADALATAFMVMGLERSLDFIKRHPDDKGVQTVFFIYSDDEGYKTYATEQFEKLKKH